MIELIEYNDPNTEKNLAMDEALLLEAEAGRMGESLRFWEPGGFDVVMGRASRWKEDCSFEDCRRDGVKMLRRMSGGGTVLQGPGCLNYSLVLSYAGESGFRDVRRSYALVLGKVSGALAARGCAAEVLSLSDIAVGARKVSGNAQARKRRFFLHHGTLLYAFPLEKVSRYLRHPREEPPYRARREHGDFMANIPLSRKDLEGCIRQEFGAPSSTAKPGDEVLAATEELLIEKYSLEGWNLSL